MTSMMRVATFARAQLFLVLLTSISPLGCSDDESSVPEGRMQDASDAASDASADRVESGLDATPDAYQDASPPDASLDAMDADAVDGDAMDADAVDADAMDADAGPSGYRASRQLVMNHLADPDIFKESETQYFLSGTGTTVSFTIYESSDLETFTTKTVYDPSSLPGSQHDYCYMWAPEMWKGADGKYRFVFSAHQVAKGQACPPSNQEVTTYYAEADDAELAFGAPNPFDNPVGQPRTMTAQGCPADGCVNAIRIDSAVWGVQEPWLFYVYFDAGNHIASFPLGNPSTVVHNCDPAFSWEESVNEAPDIFERDGKLYMFFSAGHFASQYAMYYIMADSVQELTRSRHVRRYSWPIQTGTGTILENAGHSAVASRAGEFYLFYHVGVFDNGTIQARHTYRKPLSFHPDGSLRSLDGIRFRWSKLDGHEYSLDLKPVGKPWVGPCVSVGHLGTSLSHAYHGVCADGDVVIRKEDVEAVRLYYSPQGSGVWNQYAEVGYDGFSDDMEIPIAGGHTGLLTVRWNELQAGAEYSLDVKPVGEPWRAPCVGAGVIGTDLEVDFDGTCLSGTSAGSSVALADVEQLRVCSAVGGDWSNATCATVDYDGSSMVRWILLPD